MGAADDLGVALFSETTISTSLINRLVGQVKKIIVMRQNVQHRYITYTTAHCMVFIGIRF